MGCLILALVLAACANPRMPTGGPPDTTPPALERTEPEAGAVNVAATKVRLVFTEWVDQTSFARAFTISPPVEGRLRFAWRRRRLDIHFPDALRPNTTYVLTLDNNLRDVHNVALKQPITLAFSTGPVINKGRLAGRVVEAGTGGGAAGFDVYAYAAPDSTAPDTLPDVPDYRTQTDDAGRFTFSYLSPDPLFVIALRDRNRNRRPDATEAFAVPPRPALLPDTVGVDSTLRWLATVPDTLAPVAQRVRPLSSRRLAVRFSEPVHFTRRDPAAWLLEDSLAGRPVAVRDVFLLPDDPRQVVLLTDTMAAARHRLRPAALADTSDNPVRPDTLGFLAPADPDTVRLRFLGFRPAAAGGAYVLLPAALPEVRFNQPVSPERLAEIVAVQDTVQQALAFDATTHDGTTYGLQPAPALRPGQVIVVRVAGRQLGEADTVYTRTFQRVSDRNLGALGGTAVADDTSAAVVVELFRAEDERPTRPYATARPDTSGAFLFSNLPEGTYRFRAFLDRNGNGTWDGGVILPYQPAEPVTWNTRPPTWKARWENILDETLRVDSNF